MEREFTIIIIGYCTPYKERVLRYVPLKFTGDDSAMLLFDYPQVAFSIHKHFP